MSEATLSQPNTYHTSDWSDGRDKYPTRWRATWYQYPDGGGEYVLQYRDMEEARDRFEASNYGFGAPPKPKKREQKAVRSESSIASSRGRSRSQLRRTVRGIAATHLLTLTTRERETDFEGLKRSFARFIRLYHRATGKRLQYVAVPERHPKNPAHIHLHVAVTSYLPVRLIRRLWYIALGGNGAERGSMTPGQVDMQRIKVRRASRRSVTIASYLSKYLTKSPVDEFNKKRYFVSRGAGQTVDKQSFWLDADPRDGYDALMREVLDRFPEFERSDCFNRRDFFIFRDPDAPGGVSGLFYRYFASDP